jgi:hypothetical protein
MAGAQDFSEEVAPNLTDEERRLIEKMDAAFAEDDRLEAEGKLKPFPPHLQAKMDSGASAFLPGEETPWEKLRREHPEDFEDGDEDDEDLEP